MKKHKLFYLIVFIAFIILVYTHSNTFLANDDLPYMFFHRTYNRIDSLMEILKNQYTDYFNINGRIFVHSVLQFVLIFDKNLWSFINPLMIIGSLLLIIKIVELDNKNINCNYSFMLSLILFLSLFNYKSIIYWGAGSVNYIWVFTFLLLILYLFYKYGFSKNKFINIIIIFILTMIHECTMVFTISFILIKMFFDWYKDKKFNKNYLYYIFGFLGSLVLLLSPANQNRLVSDEIWNSLNLFEKLFTSIPVVSKNLFNLMDVKYLLSYIFIIYIINLLIKNNNKFSKISIFLIIFNMLLIYTFNNNWLYFALVILLFISENFIYFNNKKYNEMALSISMYGVVFFNIISPTYYAGRPNYYFYMYIILCFINLFNKEIIKNNIFKKINYVCIPIILIVLLTNEVIVYKNIGKYHKIRLEEIKEFKENNNNGNKDTLYLTKIPDKYESYHMDINLPDENWFNYESFIYYYDLDKDIKIRYK